MGIFRLPVACDAEVSDACVAVAVEDDVFGLDVAVDDVALVEVVESFHEAADEETCMGGTVRICSSEKA